MRNVRVYGNGGNDYFDGGSGTDIEFNQVSGTVTVSGDNASNEVFVEDVTQMQRSRYGATKYIATIFVRGAGSSSQRIVGVTNVRFEGKGGNDYFYNGFDNETEIPSYFNGGSGTDYAWGGSGADELRGGPGDDVLLGQGGNDLLFGGPDDDLLIGGEGHDSLYGESGTDKLHGKAGNDGLFGGGDGYGNRDRLYGEEGKDRFLWADRHDSIRDKEHDDAVIEFVSYDRALDYYTEPVTDWTDREIEVMDIALRTLHHKTGNTFLLKDTISTDPLKIYKADSNQNYFGLNTQVNGRRRILIRDWAESSRGSTRYSSLDQHRAGVLVHEIAHNWDEPEELAPHSLELQEKLIHILKNDTPLHLARAKTGGQVRKIGVRHPSASCL